MSHKDYIGQLIDLLQDKLINLIIAKKLLEELTVDQEKLPREVKSLILFYKLLATCKI